MVARCANPYCSAPFRYLHEGKLFRVDLGPTPPADYPSGYGRELIRRVEYFWLCPQCASTNTIRVEQGAVVVLALPSMQGPETDASYANR